MFFVILELIFHCLSVSGSVRPPAVSVSGRGRGDLNVLWTIISSIGCKLKWAAAVLSLDGRDVLLVCVHLSSSSPLKKT